MNYFGECGGLTPLSFLNSRRHRTLAWPTRFLAVLDSLGYSVYRDGEVFLQLNPPSGNAWPVDLMLVNNETFEKMRSAALEVDFADAQGWIPCLEHLIALNLHALKNARLHRFLKDFQDVEGMVRKNKLDRQSERVRQLFSKYGTLDSELSAIGTNAVPYLARALI